MQREIWHVLNGGVSACSDNDYGRPWPLPNRAAIARLLGAYPIDLCLAAAKEAREIVQAQDRAPNITGLFEKKLRDLAEQHDGARSAIRDALS